MKKKREQKTDKAWGMKPHVVILGAGASKASFPNGDRYGKKIPEMKDFIDILKLAPLLDKTDVEYKGRNFEDVYADLHGKKEYTAICKELEDYIYSYFNKLEISETPCIYDHLVLSLRKKDVIATFNWDPFLIQAYQRNERWYAKLPEILFLHGNVGVGVCHKCKELGKNGINCTVCKKPYTSTKLLYPIQQKNYHEHSDIHDQWQQLKRFLKNAAIVTIFGYGAPTSDVEAMELLKKAWGTLLDRRLEQFEIIDLKNEVDLRKTWDSFIHTNHYDVRKDFYESWIVKHPRRSVEAFYGQYIANRWDTFLHYPNKTIPINADFDAIRDWFDSLYSDN